MNKTLQLFVTSRNAALVAGFRPVIYNLILNRSQYWYNIVRYYSGQCGSRPDPDVHARDSEMQDQDPASLFHTNVMLLGAKLTGFRIPLSPTLCSFTDWHATNPTWNCQPSATWKALHSGWIVWDLTIRNHHPGSVQRPASKLSSGRPSYRH